MWRGEQVDIQQHLDVPELDPIWRTSVMSSTTGLASATGGLWEMRPIVCTIPAALSFVVTLVGL